MDIREINGKFVEFQTFDNPRYDDKVCVGCPFFEGVGSCKCDHGDVDLLCKGGAFRELGDVVVGEPAPLIKSRAFEPTETQTFGPLPATTTLPTDSAVRKDIPIYSGVVAYFPAALAGVARISKQGNDKHNPGLPLHHARGKSMDHADCIVRHLIDLADALAVIERTPPLVAVDPTLALAEVSNLAWRALAYSQELHERLGRAPLAPGARA